MGHVLAHRPGSIRAVDPVKRAAQIERPHTQRVARMAARHMRRKLRVFAAHGSGRCPAGVNRLAGHMQRARPASPAAGNPDRVAHGPAGANDLIEPAVGKADDNRSGLESLPERNFGPAALRTAKKRREKSLRFRSSRYKNAQNCDDSQRCQGNSDNGEFLHHDPLSVLLILPMLLNSQTSAKRHLN